MRDGIKIFKNKEHPFLIGSIENYEYYIYFGDEFQNAYEFLLDSGFGLPDFRIGESSREGIYTNVKDIVTMVLLKYSGDK